MVAFQHESKDMIYILNHDGFHGDDQNQKQEEWPLWKKAVDVFFQGMC